MATRSEHVSATTGKHGSAVLGRSAVTGRFVMMPASKPGSISVKDARTAVKNLADGTKK